MLRITQLGLPTFLNHWVLISSFRGMKQLGLYLLPLDGMQSISGTKFASINNWLETGNVRVIKFLAQEYIILQHKILSCGSHRDHLIKRRVYYLILCFNLFTTNFCHNLCFEQIHSRTSDALQ